MRKTWLGAAMGVAAFAALTSPGFAQQAQPMGWSWLNGFYVRGDVGGAFGQSTTFKDNSPGAAGTILGTGSLNASTGNSIYFDAGIGYRFNPMFRTDFTLGYMPSLQASGTISGGVLNGFSGSAGVKSLLGLANGYLDLNGVMPNMFGPFQPYLDAGIGFANNSMGGFTAKNGAGLGVAVNGSTQTNFAWGVGAGVAYPITPNLSLDLAYKYVDLGGLKTGTTGAVLGVPTAMTAGANSNDLNVHLVTLGLRWSFSAPPPPPPALAPVAAPVARPAPAPAPAARMFIVFFDFDKATLTADGQKVVDAAAAAFKAGGNPQLQVSGYTDLSGTAAYNLKLSQRRADAVDAALIKDGVPKSAITSHAMGKNSPRVPTADGVREPQNRRVEIVFPG